MKRVEDQPTFQSMARGRVKIPKFRANHSPVRHKPPRYRALIVAEKRASA